MSMHLKKDVEHLERYAIYFWCPAVSPHLLPLFAELAEHPRVARAVYVGQKSLEPHRQALGWEIDLPEVGEIVANPSTVEVGRIVANSPGNSVHVFYGIHWVPCIVAGIKATLAYKRRFGIFSEPRVLEGAKGLLRLVHSLLTEGKIREHADFVLAIGAHGPQWFALAGYDRARIFPAAYFLDLDKPHSAANRSRSDIDPVNVAFVGRLEKTKGFHLFLGAIPLVTGNAIFHVVGTGSLAQWAIDAAAGDSRVRHVGVLPMSKVPAFLQGIDILVLTSTTTDDGWGAVISEGLAAGAAIVVSSRVGSSICARFPGNGVVLANNSPANIAAAIDRIIESDFLTAENRKERRDWALSRLDRFAGAQYLISIFDHLYQGGPAPRTFLDVAQIADVR